MSLKSLLDKTVGFYFSSRNRKLLANSHVSASLAGVRNIAGGSEFSTVTYRSVMSVHIRNATVRDVGKLVKLVPLESGPSYSSTLS